MKLFSSKYTDNTLSFGLLLLRITMGGLMIPNGYNKLMHFADMSKNFPSYYVGSTVAFSLLVFAEFLCAALVIMGLLTRFACIPLIIAMAVALFDAHKGDVFGDGGHAALFLGGFLTLLFTGPGKYSFDRVIGK